MAQDSDDINLTNQELQVLSELDSRQFGFLKLNTPEQAKKKELVLKAVKYLERMLVQAQNQKERSKHIEKDDTLIQKEINIDPKTYCKLGHFHLLLEDYAKGHNFCNLTLGRHRMFGLRATRRLASSEPAKLPLVHAKRRT
ncbi:histone demethylase UTY-like isoform X2 [Schistocerca americana]|uniref:histone demethylase UTY-like isoform X2 n=1 Tax=Schistocerca americana TaxID=7009 RepID=UPI001F4F1A81|nr:histone demethylase UTY-like isoform X2 [Schistocerca americana]